MFDWRAVRPRLSGDHAMRRGAEALAGDQELRRIEQRIPGGGTAYGRWRSKWDCVHRVLAETASSVSRGLSWSAAAARIGQIREAVSEAHRRRRPIRAKG